MTTTVDHEDFTNTSDLLADTAKEMLAQEAKWGEQNHPLIGGKAEGRNTWRNTYLDEQRYWKETNDRGFAIGELGWDGILLEEVFEALSEDDAIRAEVELIQVAAVALSMAKSLRRNGIHGGTK